MSISFMLEIVLKFMCRNMLLIDKVATKVVYEVNRVNYLICYLIYFTTPYIPKLIHARKPPTYGICRNGCMLWNKIHFNERLPLQSVYFVNSHKPREITSMLYQQHGDDASLYKGGHQDVFNQLIQCI